MLVSVGRCESLGLLVCLMVRLMLVCGIICLFCNWIGLEIVFSICWVKVWVEVLLFMLGWMMMNLLLLSCVI